jgi:hypothetical protein
VCFGWLRDPRPEASADPSRVREIAVARDQPAVHLSNSPRPALITEPCREVGWSSMSRRTPFDGERIRRRARNVLLVAVLLSSSEDLFEMTTGANSPLDTLSDLNLRVASSCGRWVAKPPRASPPRRPQAGHSHRQRRPTPSCAVGASFATFAPATGGAGRRQHPLTRIRSVRPIKVGRHLGGRSAAVCPPQLPGGSAPLQGKTVTSSAG